jgi:hypothetical protein
MDLKDFIHQRKSFLLVILMVIVFFIIFDFVAHFWLLKPLSLEESEEESEIGLTTEQETILAEFNDCLDETKEPILDIKNDQKDEYYVIAKALMEKNEEICSSLEDEKSERHCLKVFYEFMAMTNNDNSYCKRITDDSNDRQVCLAVIEQDASYCDEVENLLHQEICRAVVQGPSYCDNLSGSYDSQGVCTNIEGQEGFEETCGQVSKEEAKSLCRNSVYIAKALRERNYQMCQLIDLKTGRFTLLFCRVLTAPEPQKEWRSFFSENACYERYATKVSKIKDDPSLCEKIPLKESHNQQEYNKCIEQFK